MLSETEITAKLITSLRKDYFAMVLNLHGHALQAAGWPDLYIAHWKARSWVECKGAKTKVTPLQQNIMNELLKRGDSVFILRFTLPKIYSLRTVDEYTVIADIYGNYKQAAEGLLNEISKHQKMQNKRV